MEIGLRQTVVGNFQERFPLTSELLRKDLEAVYVSEFEEFGKPKEYGYELSIEYFEEDLDYKPDGQKIIIEERTLYESRMLAIIGQYPQRYGRTGFALRSVNLANPKLPLPPEESRVIETLFDQIKSYDLNSVPKEIEV